MQVIGGTALGISAHNLQQCRNLQHVVYWGSYTPEKVIQWMPDLPTENFKGDAYIKQIKHDGYDLLSNKDTNDNACAVSQLISKEVWNPITNKINTTIGKDVIEFTIGGPTLQMWCAAWNKVVDETDENEFKKMEAISDDSWTGYKVRVGETEDTFLFMNGTKNELDYNQLSTLQTQYPTFFPHMNKVEDCACYCLASPSAQNSGQLVGVYAGGFVVGILYNNSENGVRPVVCLKPNVKLVEKENTEDKIVYDLV